MTNAQIIMLAQMDAGIEEECHTYARWKKLGYQVQRGEKAAFSATIWKHTARKNKESGDEEAHMFMRKAHFFGRSQVKPIEVVKSEEDSAFIHNFMEV